MPLQLDASGKVKYDILAKMGQRKDKVVHTSLQAMVPKERPTDPELMKPDEEEIEKVSKERGERRSRGRENSLSIGSRVSFSEKWEALLPDISELTIHGYCPGTGTGFLSKPQWPPFTVSFPVTLCDAIILF